MDFFETVKKRCSIRAYSNRPIESEKISKIIDSARLAPTARGEEPWEFVIISKRQVLQDIASIAANAKFIKDAAVGIAVICKDTKYYLEDGSAATENMLLAATALGIGSCWIAGDKKDYAQKVLSFLSVPSGYRLVSIVVLGYPKVPTDPHPKRGLDSVIHYDKF
jgi:nitroreductase